MQADPQLLGTVGAELTIRLHSALFTGLNYGGKMSQVSATVITVSHEAFPLCDFSRVAKTLPRNTLRVKRPISS